VAKEILTYDDLLQIVELIKSAEAFSEFHLKIGEIELDLRKADAGTARGTESTPGAAAATTPSPSPSAPAIPAALTSSSVEQQPARAARATIDIPPGSVVIRSPMVGTFYRRPEPTARPFVEIGDAVDEDTTVCIIEVMKLMNSIPAGCKGRIAQILVDDAEPVAAGQQLIVIDAKG